MSSNEVGSIQPAAVNEDAASSSRHRSRPRPRPVLSCLRCRHRKVKCNRDFPCKQCISAGHADQCSYNVPPKSGESTGLQVLNGTTPKEAPSATPVTGIEGSNQESPAINRIEPEKISHIQSLESIQQRLQKLERLCVSQSGARVGTTSNEYDIERSNGPLPKADASLSIKRSGSRLHSQSYKKSLFRHFRSPGRFIISGFNDPERAATWNELRRYHEKFTKVCRKNNKQETTASWISSHVLGILPTREVCDEAVSSYFKYFEKCLRILHYQSFMQTYARFWQSDEVQRHEFKYFVPQLAIIVAIIYAWEGVSTPGGDEEAQAEILSGHVEEWLESLRGRKQLTMATLRTQALLIVSQQVRSAQPDDVWKATGKLLRSAMVAGLHRDPAEFPDISIFEGELRRRLWMTILELDIGASIVYGMPTMVHEGDFTCSSPSNVDDVELHDDMKEIPESKPLHETTDSVFQVALTKSQPLRLRAIGGTFNRVDDVQLLIIDLERYIQSLPSNLRPDVDSEDEIRHTLGRVFLHVYIRRTIAYLHHTCISLTDLAPETVTSGIQSSLSILSFQQLLDIENPESYIDQRGSIWELFHILCRNDIMQAALDICLHAQAPGLVSWTKASLLLAIDDTIANLMRRISKNGSDVKDVIRLSVISQMLKSQIQQRNGEEMMTEGAVNVLMACRRAARSDETGNDGGGNEMDMNHPTSPNTQLAMENGNSTNDWTTTIPNDPVLTSHELESFLNMDGANYDLLETYTFGGSSSTSDLWSQY